MRYYTAALEVPLLAASPAGASTKVSHLTEKVVQVIGYVDGTFQTQISVDGTHFADYGAAFTGNGVLEITCACHSVRIDTTVDSTVVPTIVVAGMRGGD